MASIAFSSHTFPISTYMLSSDVGLSRTFRSGLYRLVQHKFTKATHKHITLCFMQDFLHKGYFVLSMVFIIHSTAASTQYLKREVTHKRKRPDSQSLVALKLSKKMETSYKCMIGVGQAKESCHNKSTALTRFVPLLFVFTGISHQPPAAGSSQQPDAAQQMPSTKPRTARSTVHVITATVEEVPQAGRKRSFPQRSYHQTHVTSILPFPDIDEVLHACTDRSLNSRIY